MLGEVDAVLGVDLFLIEEGEVMDGVDEVLGKGYAGIGEANAVLGVDVVERSSTFSSGSRCSSGKSRCSYETI